MSSPLTLQRVPQAELGVEPIEWGGLNRRYMNAGELEVLVALARQVRAETVIEFGCNEGRTAKALLLNVPSIARYVGVDVPPGTALRLAVQRREVPARAGHLAADDPRFTLALRPNGTRDLSPEELPRADLVFIDGDHSWQGVLHDTMLATALVRAGGVIVWHDYHNQGTVEVRDVLELLDGLAARAGFGRRIMHVDGTWLAYAKR